MRLTVRELVVYSLLGAIMYVSKVALEFLPNVHMLAAFTVAYTVCFRKKALYPIYIYVFINGLFAGFSMWWIPYLYLWTLLWAATMLLPRNMKPQVALPVYMALCGLHGFLFGTLYAPAQAIMFGLSFEATITWIIAGLPSDAVHGVSNIFMGTLVLPISQAIKRVGGTMIQN